MKKSFSLTTPLLIRLAEVWRWWLDELIGILPQKIQDIALPSKERLYLEATGKEVIASRGTEEETEQVGRYPLTDDELPLAQARVVEELSERARETVLTLPANKVLAKTLTLPLVAETNLREVLGFEMDRQTPFTLDQVYYDHILSSRNARSNTISVELIVTPRNYLDELLENLNDIGLQPHHVDVMRQNGSRAQLDKLLPDEARKPRRNSARVLNIALTLVALALLSATIALPLMEKIKIINALEAKVELATRKAQVVQRLDEEVQQLSTGSGFLAEKKRENLLVIETIGELTRILPDNTWINQLTIKGREFQIQGFSTSAEALIPVIDASAKFHNPRFRSSVTSSLNSDSERFHLSAEITGRESK